MPIKLFATPPFGPTPQRETRPADATHPKAIMSAKTEKEARKPRPTAAV